MLTKNHLALALLALLLGAPPLLGKTCSDPGTDVNVECGTDQCYQNQIGELCDSGYSASRNECYTYFLQCWGNAKYIVTSNYGYPGVAECARRTLLISPCPGGGGCPDPPSESHGPGGPKVLVTVPLSEPFTGLGILNVDGAEYFVTLPVLGHVLVPVHDLDDIVEMFVDAAAQIVRRTPSEAELSWRGGLILLRYKVVADPRFVSGGEYNRRYLDPWALGDRQGAHRVAYAMPVRLRLVEIVEGAALLR